MSLAQEHYKLHAVPRLNGRFVAMVLLDLPVLLEVKSSLRVEGTPWKINMEHKNHPFRKENDLPNLYDYVPC